MASLKTRERQIANLEGFDINFLNSDGRNARSDLQDVQSYNYDRAARGDMTVTEWKQKRFKQRYPDYECEVLDSAGTAVHGATKLSNVRETYQGE